MKSKQFLMMLRRLLSMIVLLPVNEHVVEAFVGGRPVYQIGLTYVLL